MGDKGLVTQVVVAGKAGEKEEVAVVHGAFDGDYRALIRLEAIDEKIDDILGCSVTDFNSDGVAPLALAKLFFHDLKKVLGFFFVEVQVAIPGDASDIAIEDFSTGENKIEEKADKISQKDKAGSSVTAWEGNESGKNLRNFDKGKKVIAPGSIGWTLGGAEKSGSAIASGGPSASSKSDTQTETAVGKMGKGVGRINSQRG
jgi:hypothetical protein